LTVTQQTISEAMLPKGVKDFLPIKAAKIEHLKQTLHGVFHRWAFRPVIPPSLEFLHVLEKGMGEGLREKTFRFDDRQNGKLVAFSPDITPQVARIVATRMQQAPLPQRLCYSGQVLRHAEQQAGKDREIFQTGVELIGLAGPEADAEMIAMAVECLQALGAEEFTIDIGQVEFFRGVMADLPLSAEQAQQVQCTIGRKDNSGLAELLSGLQLEDRDRQAILALPRLYGGREVLDRAEKAVANDRSRKALENLRQVLEVLEVYGVEKHITFDLGELRGVDYHTGITFQGFLGGLGQAVCSGGRYDNLTARYGLPAPATGFAFNLLHLLSAFDKQLEKTAAQYSDVLIFQAGSNKQPAQRAAQALRQQGYSVARDIIERQLEDSIQYAHKMNYRFVMVVGGPDDTVRLIRLADDMEQQIPYRSLLAEGFCL
jgi:ATP phosphoribosyltransferase regulatory subunit